MGVRFDRRWVYPTDVTIRAAVNQIDAAVSSVTKNHHRHARHIELHHGFAHREPLQRRGRFGNDHRVPLSYLLLAVMCRRSNDIARRVDRRAVRRLSRLTIGSRHLMVLGLLFERRSRLFQRVAALAGAALAFAAGGAASRTVPGTRWDTHSVAEAEPF